ncbi:hypothetical protein MMPV_000607 [Pyropia vietnamensis]
MVAHRRTASGGGVGGGGKGPNAATARAGVGVPPLPRRSDRWWVPPPAAAGVVSRSPAGAPPLPLGTALAAAADWLANAATSAAVATAVADATVPAGGTPTTTVATTASATVASPTGVSPSFPPPPPGPPPCPVARLELDVDPTIPPLSWLREQPPRERLYFRCRDGRHETAAAGFAVTASGAGGYGAAAHAALIELLPPDAPLARFYGGIRFDAGGGHDGGSDDGGESGGGHGGGCDGGGGDGSGKPGDWSAFRGYTFVLPALELQRLNGAFPDRSRSVLAVNILAADPSVIAAAAAAVAAATDGAPPVARGPPHTTARAATVTDVDNYSRWRSSMATVLAAIAAGTYDKIVLARRKAFRFDPASPPDAVAVAAALQARQAASSAAAAAAAAASGASGASTALAAARGTYLFVLQLADGTAFVGCTPERLFRLDGVRISSQALAGTIRCAGGGRGGVGGGGGGGGAAAPFSAWATEGGGGGGGGGGGSVKGGPPPPTVDETVTAGHDRVARDAMTALGSVDPDTAAAARALLGSRKDRTEHAYVVDYVARAMGDCGATVSTAGPVIVRLPQLLHLSTQISGSFADGGPSDNDDDSGAGGGGGVAAPSHKAHALLSRMHPTPAVCGTPRAVTQAGLRSLEPFDRGLYAGPLGCFSRTASDFCVALRSAVLSGDTVTAYAGSGVVAGSSSRAEWDEAELKMAPFTELFHPHRRVCTVVDADVSVEALARREGDGLTEGDLSDERSGSDDGHADGANRSNGDNGDVETASTTVAASSGRRKGTTAGPPPIGPVANGHGRVLVPRASAATPSPSSLGSGGRPSAELAPFDPSHLAAAPNLNALWGSAVVDELIRLGVGPFFVCPGSRSAPLAGALAASRHATVIIAHDERGAAFAAAAAAAAAGGRPAAVVTSSGTAVANLLPGVVEAAASGVPLVLLTADRPPEARGTSANQTIEQAGLLGGGGVGSAGGGLLRAFRDVACPTADVPLRRLLADVDAAVAAAVGVAGVGEPGPVHLNFMFREPLHPAAVPWPVSAVLAGTDRWARAAVVRWGGRRVGGAGGVDAALLETLRGTSRGVVLAGGGLDTRRGDRYAVLTLGARLGWPVVADSTSGLRGYGLAGTTPPTGVVEHLDPLLAAAAPAASRPPPSAALAAALAPPMWCFTWAAGSFAYVVVAGASGRRLDEHAAVTHRLAVSPAALVAALAVAPAVPLPPLLPPSSVTATAVPLSNGYAHPSRVPNGVAGSSTSSSTSSTSSAAAANDSDNGSTTEEDRDVGLSILLDLSAAAAAVLDHEVAAAVSAGDAPAGCLTEPLVARLVAAAVPPGESLFLSNSMPVRDVDAFAGRGGTVPAAATAAVAARGAPPPPSTTTAADNDEDTARANSSSAVGGWVGATVAANRGASGIDGIVSSAIGWAVGSGSPVTLLVGDMALLHDGCGFHMYGANTASGAASCGVNSGRGGGGSGGGGGSDGGGGSGGGSPALPPLRTVVVNNGGGGIFSFLPVASSPAVFGRAFSTPHDANFGGLASTFGLLHTRVTTASGLAAALASGAGRTVLIEAAVGGDHRLNVAEHGRLVGVIAAAAEAVLAGEAAAYV